MKLERDNAMSPTIMTYREAIIAAQRDALRADPCVLVMGEDIGESGGVFKTTEGLWSEFGSKRVRDTPISETGFVGAALGMAVAGYRPVVEIMFADFMGVCFDQLVNSIAKHRFMSGGKVSAPLVIRTACGGGLQFGAQHSQTAESWLLSIPGIKIAVPASPAEAYRLLRAAIRDDNPVVVLEHKGLLGTKGPVDVGEPFSHLLGGPEVVRVGDAVTIVASLAMVPRAMAAAEVLAHDGISAEVIDLRVLRPLALDPVVKSLRKTHSLVTVEEQSRVGGWGAEVVAQMVATAFDYLDSPPLRIAMGEYPLPFSKPLEDAARPTTDRIVREVRELLRGTA